MERFLTIIKKSAPRSNDPGAVITGLMVSLYRLVQRTLYEIIY